MGVLESVFRLPGFWFGEDVPTVLFPFNENALNTLLKEIFPLQKDIPSSILFLCDMKESYLVGKLDDTSVLLFAIDSVP